MIHPRNRHLMAALAVPGALLVGDASAAGGVDGWQSVTLCYRSGYVPAAEPLEVLSCCPGRCPSTQQCADGVGCGEPSCAPTDQGDFVEFNDPDGTCSFGQVQYWSAPLEFLQSLPSAACGFLTFTLQDVGGSGFIAQEDVIIDGAGLRVVRSIAAGTPVAWTDFTAPLTSGGWTVDGPGGAPASASQLAAVLAVATALYVRAEYGFGDDTQRLMDVGLAAPDAGDLSGDNLVNGVDIGLLLASWGACSAPPAMCCADLNDDGAVDGADLGVLLGAWTG